MKYDKEKERLLFESSGRIESPNCGIIGLSHDDGVFGGYDSSICYSGQVLNTKERLEIADYMIAMWTAYKERTPHDEE